MDKIYKVKVENAYSVKFARSQALRKCVFDTPDLKQEFYKIINVEDNSDQFRDQFREKLRKFISDNELRIISEKPVARVKGDRYAVDVYFKITW